MRVNYISSPPRLEKQGKKACRETKNCKSFTQEEESIMATEEGDIKDKDKEVDLLGEIAVSANNQGKSIPRKRDYRQRAHCNPLSLSLIHI